MFEGQWKVIRKAKYYDLFLFFFKFLASLSFLPMGIQWVVSGQEWKQSLHLQYLCIVLTLQPSATSFTWRFSCFQDKQWLHWVSVNVFNQIALFRTKDNLLFKILDHGHERIHSRLILAWQRISPHLLWRAPLCAQTKWTLARLASMSWIPLLTAACSTSLTESAWVGSITRNLALVNDQRQMPHPGFFFFFPAATSK